MPENPTVSHGHRAEQQGIFSEILLVSNFDGRGPAAVGSYPALGPVGTYDMAGNVREWCVNRTGDRRYILGGAWSEPNYMYRDPEAADPLDRSLKNGVRCVRTDDPVSSSPVGKMQRHLRKRRLPMIGRNLSHYEITAKLGEGGLGEVWRAPDTSPYVAHRYLH